MAQKNATLRALIGEETYDLMPKGSVYNIYVDDITTLAQKLQEIVNALNGKVTPQQLEEVMLENGIIKRDLLPDGYPYQGEVELLRVNIASMTDDGYPITQPLGLVIGNTYEVEWNGTAYSCVAEGVNMDGVTFAALGDTGLWVTGEPTGAYPFVLLEIPSDMVTDGVYAAFIPLDGTAAGTLVVGGGGIIPIDRKWLPEGYPYIIDAGITVLGETTITYESGTQFKLPVALNPNATYKITWNGTEYTVAPQNVTNALGDFVCWGNASMHGGATTEEPFVIMYGESYGWFGMALDESTAPTMKIVTEKSYIPFDKRYMPGGGGLNLVNGTATGSLIGASAVKESDTYSIGGDSMAIGHWSKAAGDNAFAFGIEAIAEGNGSFAFGNLAKATSVYAFAVGDSVTASGVYSHAEGYGTKAEGRSTHAEGWATTASEPAAHAEGGGTTASGNSSHAEGGNSVASGGYSHAEGRKTIAASENQHAQGRCNIEDADGKYAHIVGNGSIAGNGDVTRSNAHTLDWQGNAWFAGSVEGTALILTAPGGKRFNITVDDSGALTAAEIAE